MKKKLTLSLIIPAYNEEHHLADCLKAVADQTVMPDEVIVVDNDSTDRTVEIAQSYPFVRIISEPKRSVLYARTTGFNAAKSDIIGRIDADTNMSPTWVARVLQDFEDAELAAVAGAGYWYDMPLSPSNYYLEHFFRAVVDTYIKKAPLLSGFNMALRRDVWLKIRDQLCDKKSIHEDLDLAVHLYKEGYKITYDKKMLVGTSARRYDDKPKDFYTYMRDFRHTYSMHGLSTASSNVAIPAYVTGYILLRPLRLSYNPETHQYSLTHLLRGGNKPRKHPMH